MNKKIAELIKEKNKYKELLLTFKDMFTDNGNALYLEMINNTLKD